MATKTAKSAAAGNPRSFAINTTTGVRSNVGSAFGVGAPSFQTFTATLKNPLSGFSLPSMTITAEEMDTAARLAFNHLFGSKRNDIRDESLFIDIEGPSGSYGYYVLADGVISRTNGSAYTAYMNELQDIGDAISVISEGMAGHISDDEMGDTVTNIVTQQKLAGFDAEGVRANKQLSFAQMYGLQDVQLAAQLHALPKTLGFTIAPYPRYINGLSDRDMYLSHLAAHMMLARMAEDPDAAGPEHDPDMIDDLSRAMPIYVIA